MTIPYLMNCSHSGEGWCLDCVKELGDENATLKNLIVELEYGLAGMKAGAAERIAGLEEELQNARKEHRWEVLKPRYLEALKE